MLQKPKILVVDDEAGIRLFLQDALEREGYQVVAVESGEKALALVAVQEFDLALLDIKMKGVGGLEVLAALRQHWPNTPVIMLTAYASLETAVEALRRGAHDYLFKPVAVDDLRQSVRAGLQKRSSMDAASQGTEQRPEQADAVLDTLKTTFMRNVSHELRTPLSIIYGYADLLETGDLGALAPEQREAALTIRSRADELRTMVERIDTLMAIDAHRGIPTPLALGELVAQAVSDWQPGAVKAGLTMTMHLQQDLGLVEGDQYHLRQMVDCLLDNAIKFTPAGGMVEVRVYTTPPADSQEPKEGWVCLEIKDSGIGIPEQELEYILAGFHQVDGSTTRRYGGIGLGLTVTNAVVTEYGGRVEIESKLGQGSQVLVKLPVLEPGEQVEYSLEGRNRELRRVLVVDDEENVAMIIQSSIEAP